MPRLTLVEGRSSWRGRFASGALWGVVAGIILGAFAYAPVMASLDPLGNTLSHDKVEAWYRRVGIVYGIPFGAFGGVLLVGGLWLFIRTTRDRSE